MNETGLSAFDLHLQKAEELIERGKPCQAFDQLWHAEALARGDAEAIRRLLERARAYDARVEPRQKIRLVELLAALEHHPRHATEAAPLPPPLAESTPASGFYLGLILSLLLAAGASAVILFIWLISATTVPCSPHDFICIFGDDATSGAGAHLAGTGKGLLYGGIGLLLLSGYTVARLRARLTHPFLMLIVGFPLLYGVVLLSIWGVARGIWGPTK
jgi:hypothetical protein